MKEGKPVPDRLHSSLLTIVVVAIDLKASLVVVLWFK